MILIEYKIKFKLIFSTSKSINIWKFFLAFSTLASSFSFLAHSRFFPRKNVGQKFSFVSFNLAAAVKVSLFHLRWEKALSAKKYNKSRTFHAKEIRSSTRSLFDMQSLLLVTSEVFLWPLLGPPES